MRCILAENEVTLNEDQFLLSSLTRACKLKNDVITTRLPLRRDLVRLIVNQVQHHFNKPSRNQPYLGKLCKALFVALYFGLLRIGEVTASPHMILARNVHMGVNKNKLCFILDSSKMHTKGNKSQIVKIEQPRVTSRRENKNIMDPFKLIGEYIEARPAVKSLQEQLFCIH